MVNSQEFEVRPVIIVLFCLAHQIQGNMGDWIYPVLGFIQGINKQRTKELQLMQKNDCNNGP